MMDIHYNTKRALSQIALFSKSLLQPFQKFHRATCT
nr:MAG TPA: hypothetical protein [Caudoviricetes sp.]